MAVTVRILENFIGGDWAASTSDAVRPIVSPVTGETLAEVPDASAADIDSAVPPVMVMACSLPVARSFAETFTMPLASMSNATSICGTFRGAGGRPVRWNLPSDRTPGE